MRPLGLLEIAPGSCLVGKPVTALDGRQENGKVPPEVQRMGCGVRRMLESSNRLRIEVLERDEEDEVVPACWLNRFEGGRRQLRSEDVT